MDTREPPVNRIFAPPCEDATLDLTGVAKLLRVHPITVRRMLSRDEFVKPFRAGACLRWKRSAVDAWIAAGGAGRQMEVRSASALSERRYAPQHAVVARSDGGRRTIAGYGAVFYRAGDAGTEFELTPGVFERINPKAFDGALSDGSDVISLFNHSPDSLLGRTTSGTLRLSVDSRGLRYEVDLPDTSTGDDVWALAQRGDLRGSSFCFYPGKSLRSRDGDREVIERIDVQLCEIGPVISPAYPATTAAASGGSGGSDSGGRSKRDADLIAVTVALMDMDEAESIAPGSAAAIIQGARAGCRKLLSEIDRERIAAVIGNTTGRARPQPVRPVCGQCREPLDSFNECGCD